MSESTSNQRSGGWGFGSFFESMKKMSSEVTKMASDFVDKSANEAIRIYGEIKTKGEDMINEINAKEKELNEEHVEVLPWLLPVFEKTPMYQGMMKEDIFALSKDADTFLKSVEGCEDDQYSPAANSKLIVLLREQDINLQKIRLQLVQKDKLVSDEVFWRNYVFRVLQIIKNYKQTVEEETKGKVTERVHEEVVQEGQVGVSSTTVVQEDSKQPVDVQQQEEKKTDEPENPTKPIDDNNSEEPIEPMEAPSSTIPEVVHTVEDIYDFDDMSDIEKEMSDVDLEEVEDGDLSDIEAEILAEL